MLLEPQVLQLLQKKLKIYNNRNSNNNKQYSNNNNMETITKNCIKEKKVYQTQKIYNKQNE